MSPPPAPFVGLITGEYCISKTKGLRENLTAPRDVADIFPPETIST